MPIAALLWLSGCASDPEVRVVTETKTVEVEVEVYGKLPQTLTEPLVRPAELQEGFTEQDLWNQVFDLYDVLDLADADRARAGRIASGVE